MNALDSQLSVVKRAEWMAAPPKGIIMDLPTPVPHILFIWTGEKACTTKEECIKSVQELQRKHMVDMEMPDIQYNFMVGEDGYVYEGRGWTKMCPALSSSIRNSTGLNGRTYMLGLIEPLKTRPSKSMVESISELISYAVVKRYVAEGFECSVLMDGEIQPLSDVNLLT